MKRAFAGFFLVIALAGRLAAQTDVVAMAAQKAMEEDIRRLGASITQLEAAQEQQKKDTDELRGAIQQLRSELGKINQSAIVQELQNTMRKLDDKIMKVDESRASDSKRIFEALKDLGKLVADRPAPPAPPSVTGPSPGSTRNSSAPSHTPDTSPGPGTSRSGAGNIQEEGYEYVIQNGDFLDRIVQRYREKNIMVTRKMVMDANPTVKWERLKVGTKIFIPKPK